MKKFVSKFLVASVVFVALLVTKTSANSSEEMEEMLMSMQEELDLSDNQVGQVHGLIVDFRTNIDGVMSKYEDEDEPDVGSMIGELKDVKDDYHQKLEGVLSKDQLAIYEAKVNEILIQMFNDLAEIKLMTVQPEIALTDGQVESLTPIVGESMMSTAQLMFKHAGTRLSLPKKVSIGKSMKKIEKEKRSKMEQILTPEQLAAYDAYKKEQKKNK